MLRYAKTDDNEVDRKAPNDFSWAVVVICRWQIGVGWKHRDVLQRWSLARMRLKTCPEFVFLITKPLIHPVIRTMSRFFCSTVKYLTSLVCHADVFHLQLFNMNVGWYGSAIQELILEILCIELTLYASSLQWVIQLKHITVHDALIETQHFGNVTKQNPEFSLSPG